MENLAELVDADWSRVAESSRRSVRYAFADVLGVALAAVGDPPYRTLAAYLRDTGAGPVPLPGGGPVSARHAAIGWGMLAHARDYDDVSEVLHGHPSAVLVPAILALGYRTRASGAALLDAYLSGYEALGRVAAAAADVQRARGWHTTATIGVLGATVAAARILRLTRAQAVHSLGIATSMASGVQANFGSMTKPLHAGWAAGNAVTAAELAAAGFEGGPAALTSDANYLQVFGGEWPPPAAAAPYIDAGIRFKPYPCCGSATGLVDCAVELAPGVRGAEIAAVTCTMPAQINRTLRYTDPERGDQARFSVEYCVARGLTDGALTEACFRDGFAARPAEVRSLMRRVTRVPDDALPPNAKDVTVTVRLAGGRELRAASTAPKGHPANPMSAAELRAKFAACTADVLPAERGAAAFDRLTHLDREPAADALVDDLLMGVTA